nr:hypothetical protein [Tanacetum cinerariifolium]
MPTAKLKLLAPGRYAIDIEPIPLCLRNNKEAHLDYLKHLKESVETLHEIVEEAKVKRPLDKSLASACLYTKHSQELLEYVIGTCPKDLNQRNKKHAATPVTRKKQFTFVDPSRYAIDIEPIPLCLRNNKEAHLDYLKHLKESVETLHEIVEEAKVKRPLDKSLASACLYTKHSQELLEYVIGTCPKDLNQRNKKHAATPVTRKKQFTFVDPSETSTNNTLIHVKQQTMHQTNEPHKYAFVVITVLLEIVLQLGLKFEIVSYVKWKGDG